MEKREEIIRVITSPLGFFALSLLIIEGFLGIVVIGAGATLSTGAKLTGMYIAAAAFFIIVILVALMVWLIPENLLLRGEDWQERAKGKHFWADDRNPSTKKEVNKLKQTER